MRTRMPFRYGITTLTALPHLFLRATIEIDGRQQVGITADHLPPKWFTKNPDTSAREDIAGLLEVIGTARDVARATPKSDSVFAWWQRMYEGMAAWGGGWGKPPLLVHFGTSLVERAVIDAFCRAEGTTFAKALRGNWFGVDLGAIHRELGDAKERHSLCLVAADVRRDVRLGRRVGEAAAARALRHQSRRARGD